MTDSCQRWIALSDRRAVGENLSTSELEFTFRHARDCSGCRAEARVWQALHGALEQQDLLDSPLVLEPERSRRIPRKLAYATGFAALSAIVALGWPEASENTTTDSRRSRIAFVSGEATLNGGPVRASTSLSAGDVLRVGDGLACALLEPAITICADAHSEIRVKSLNAPRRRLELRQGRAVAKLARQTRGSTFGIETSKGVLVAKGTTFAVEVTQNQDVRLRVHEGTVSSELSTGNTHDVHGLESARLEQNFERAPLSVASREQDSKLIRLASFWKEEASGTLDVGASPGGGLISLDGALLGNAPLSALVGPGTHRIAVDRPGFSPVVERLTMSGGEHLVRNYELVPIAASSESGPDASTNALAKSEQASKPATRPRATQLSVPPSAAELLSEARTLRTKGRFNDASAAYRRLLAAHPRSAEARAALVSLGELQLVQLGSPAVALASFEAYLKTGGALSQEARFGRIRALKKLGRAEEERAAIAQFVLDYPNSVQAASLRSRLQEP